MSDSQSKTGRYSLFVIFIASISFLGNEVPRTQSFYLGLSYFTAFFSYILLSRTQSGKLSTLVVLGLLSRFSLLFTLPNLSDDFYRFVWDGILLTEGINPYSYLPREVLEFDLPGIDQDLFSRLNSPSYYSIYPPLNQIIFLLATMIGSSLIMQVNIIRLILIAADIGSLYILRKLKIGRSGQILFFLNPLIILEFTGNVHFEGLVIFFILLTIWMLQSKQPIRGALSLGLAAGFKLIPLIFIPAIAWKTRWKNGLIVAIVTLFVFSLSMVPVFTEGQQVFTSIQLYFQSFEFNASFYFILREIGFWFKGYNVIGELGPKLAITTFILIILWTVWSEYKKRSLPTMMLFSLMIYLSLATTVHPWYITPLIPLGLLSGFYFPVLWSLLIFGTYLGYRPDGYEHNIWIVVIEYVLVWIMLLLELRKKHESQVSF